MDTIGARVREARQRRGMSRADLARAAGLSGGAVSRIESGERSPGAETLARLARALSVESGQLMGAPALPTVTVAPPVGFGAALPPEVIEAMATVARAMPALPVQGRQR